MKSLKKVLAATISSLVVLSFISCGSAGGGKYDAPAAYDSAMTEAVEEPYYNGGYEESIDSSSYDEGTSSDLKADNSKLTDTNRKLIKTYTLDLETEHFDDFLVIIENRINELNGYVQNLDTYNGSSYSGYSNSRYSNMTVRIPKNSLEDFVSFIGNSANVKSKNLSVEDVTLSYVDTKAKKETYEIEQERLLSLLEKADSIEDMLTIESRLSEVRYKLESQEATIRTYDNLVDYATVYLRIDEVKKYTAPEPVSYWDRVANSFTDGLEHVIESLQNFLIWFVGAFPALVLWAIFITIIVLVVKAINRKREKNGKKKIKNSVEDMVSKNIHVTEKKDDSDAK